MTPHITNNRVLIIREDNKTRMWIADTPGAFKEFPNYTWGRELSNFECAELTENPWVMHKSIALRKEMK